MSIGDFKLPLVVRVWCGRSTSRTRNVLSSDVILTHLYLQNIEELDPDFIMAKQVEQLEKEKKELQERLKNQEKKVIYLSDVGVKMSRILF